MLRWIRGVFTQPPEEADITGPIKRGHHKVKISAALRLVADIGQHRCIAVTSTCYLPVIPFSAKARAMSHFMIDVETIPGDYSMISFGAVLVNERLDQTFYGRLKPISERWVPEALAVSVTRAKRRWRSTIRSK